MAEVLVTSDTAMFCGTDGGPAVKHNVWMCVVSRTQTNNELSV